MSIEEPTSAVETEKKEIPVSRVHATKEGYISDEDFKAKEESEKKQAIAKALKEAQFAKDPDMFIHVDDIVVAAIKSDRGIGIAIGRCQRQEMEMSLTRLNYKVFSLFQDLDMRAMMMAKQRGLVVPPEAGNIIT